MERLTKRLPNGRCAFAGDRSPTENVFAIPSILKRLAAYEDTGLEPEELMALVSQQNKPLTLEELFDLDQEPVWVHYFGCQAFHKSAWAFVCAKHGYCETARGGIERFEMYGKAWIAYHRKPEERTSALAESSAPAWAAYLQSRFLRVE